MLIGLIDVDNCQANKKVFPNLVIMKLSGFYKSKGNIVKWYDPLDVEVYDIVFMSKVFSFTPDYPYPVNAKNIVKGGTGYSIELVNGKEQFNSEHKALPEEIEHTMPDYSLYGITDTAYGFLTRGCPRGCNFCVVGKKEGLCSHKVADLKEFWTKQKYIVIMDPNILACKDWKELLQQLIDSHAYIDFNQGLDIRLMTAEKASMLKQVKVKQIHFAMDRYEDKELIFNKLKLFQEATGWDRHKVTVYILCNFDTTMEQNLERIYAVKSLGFSPYVMLYDKEHVERGSDLLKLQRWVNNRVIFNSCDTFEEYKPSW